MEKIVKKVQPPARKISPYAFPGMVKPETIRKDAPKPEEKKTSPPSPYVAPGLKKDSLSLVPGRE